MTSMANRTKVLREISAWGILLVALLNALGYPIRSEVATIPEVFGQVADSVEDIRKLEEKELMYEFPDESADLETE